MVRELRVSGHWLSGNGSRLGCSGLLHENHSSSVSVNVPNEIRVVVEPLVVIFLRIQATLKGLLGVLIRWTRALSSRKVRKILRQDIHCRLITPEYKQGSQVQAIGDENMQTDKREEHQ